MTTRFHRLAAASSFAIVLAACDVGQVTTQSGGSTGSADDPGSAADDGPGPDAGADTVGTGADAAPGDCDPQVQGVASGEHNAGLDCRAGGCHAPGGEGPTWTIGGTIYSTLAGGAPRTGATIHIVDANGAELTLTSAANGNFYTGAAIAFPIHVSASSCPDSHAMAGTVLATGGGCNQSGCHDSDMRVSLP